MDNQKTIFDVSNGELIVKSPEPLTDSQRQYYKSNKTEIMAALRFKKLQLPDTDHADILDWYQNDFEIVAGLDDPQLSFLVFDYLEHRDSYRKQCHE